MVALETELGEALKGRARILRQARELFMARGYAPVSMQQIADAAAVNKATLYHHFRDKEDLFVSVMAEEFTRMTGDVAAALGGEGPLRERLRRVAIHIIAVRHSDFGRLATDLRQHVSESRQAALMGRLTPPWLHIRTAIEESILAGEVRDVDPDLVARLFFAMVGSQVWFAKYGTNYPAPDERLAGTIVDLLLNGIRADHAERAVDPSVAEVA